MGPDEVLNFLKAIDAELAGHAREGEGLDLYLIGRSALILRYGVTLATKGVLLPSRSCPGMIQGVNVGRFG
jgi:hypothetical protein